MGAMSRVPRDMAGWFARGHTGVVADITYRPMTSDDIGSVPIGHMGSEAEVRARIDTIGSAALLAFDGDQHVGQLQFRVFEAGVRSPNSLWDPLYWMDFAEHQPTVPDRSLAVFCYHVGQLDDTDERDTNYMGRGIGLRLLDELIDWAHRGDFGAIVAKAAPSNRAVMAFMGGQPREGYEQRGFQTVSTWADEDLAQVVRERELVTEGDLSMTATVGCCVLRLR